MEKRKCKKMMVTQQKRMAGFSVASFLALVKVWSLNKLSSETNGFRDGAYCTDYERVLLLVQTNRK